MKRILLLTLPAAALLLAMTACTTLRQPSDEAPRIVNIVNFVRLLEPRPVVGQGEELLYETVVNQIELLNRHGMPGTFLLQYDALITPRYVALMKEQLGPDSEVGAWWEITQPHVEAAGMTWRGRFPWDWHANVGFATGYTPREREILVDTYMKRFKETFGRYPASVGSWFIDAHTLRYMVERYGITASCNCRDQVGTDGYTLWGGYWNQAYYPSRLNAYMPAQEPEGQIDVPVFRMLGSDPVAQYDEGEGGKAAMHNVLTLEPVSMAGRDPAWVRWFLTTMSEGPCLAFNYIQAGQENSFVWEQQIGITHQIPLIDSLRRAGCLRVETLETSGRWFKENFPLTPPTAVTATSSFSPHGARTAWYDSRFYRANLYWEGEGERFRVRDLHLFDERYASDYLTEAGTSTECIYTTLPIVDGYGWSRYDTMTAGWRMVWLDEGVEASGGEPRMSEPDRRTLLVEWPLADDAGVLSITLREDRIEVAGPAGRPWALRFTAMPDAPLPFTGVTPRRLAASLNGFEYRLDCLQGFFDGEGTAPLRAFHILPDEGRIVLDTSSRP